MEAQNNEIPVVPGRVGSKVAPVQWFEDVLFRGLGPVESSGCWMVTRPWHIPEVAMSSVMFSSVPAKLELGLAEANTLKHCALP